VLYDFTETRAHGELDCILDGFAGGVLVGDGYAGYDTWAEKRSGVVVAGCWAHALRKFRDAMAEAPVLAVQAMSLIGRLFEVEQEADEAEHDDEARLELRSTRSRAAIDELEAAITGWRQAYSESGLMAKACTYIENQRKPLRAFLGHARVPIHNNACERAIRTVAVGRRNWLFAGSPRGGRAAATIYTLI
jgi:hypothetical protein